MTEPASLDRAPVLLAGVASDRGLRRELNEDAYLTTDPLFVVADGMGGHEAGEVAARECVRVLAETATAFKALAADSAGAAQGREVLQEGLRQADASIRALSGARAGTTVSGLASLEGIETAQLLLFNVGDSRVYLFAAGLLKQMSVDHSEVQELIEAGHLSAAEARYHPRRHVVTRALGIGEDTEADYELFPLRSGDRWLICTDGLSDELQDDDIAAVLGRGASPQDTADELVQAALNAGGRDNVTVIVIDVEVFAPPSEEHHNSEGRPER